MLIGMQTSLRIHLESSCACGEYYAHTAHEHPAYANCRCTHWNQCSRKSGPACVVLKMNVAWNFCLKAPTFSTWIAALPVMCYKSIKTKKKEMLIYSIAECTFVVVFSQHSGGMPVSLLLVGRHMLSYSILHDKNTEKQSHQMKKTPHVWSWMWVALRLAKSWAT